MSALIELTTANFGSALEEHDFLLIEFWAPWCAPCKSFSETIKIIATEYPEVVFGSVNIDVEVALAEEFSVISVPRVMILRDHTVVYDDVGSLSASALRQLLNDAKNLKA